MGYNFPDSPAPGDVFAPPGGPVWRWNGYGWEQQQPTPAVPEAPIDGTPYERQDAEWVPASGGGGGVTDGDKGDIVVSGTGATWLFDPTIVTAAARTVLDDATTTDMLTTLGAEPFVTAGTTAQYWQGTKSWQTLDKAAVGLGNVDNVSDANAPVSTAQAAADALKYDKTGGTLTGNVTINVATPTVQLQATSGTQFAQIMFQRGTGSRWTVYKDNVAEGGSNAGADFGIARHSDAGTTIDSPIKITRSTGVVAMPNGATLAGGAAAATTTDVTTATGLNVLKAGDTMSGPLIVAMNSANVNLQSSSGANPSQLIFSRSSSATTRWVIMKDNTAESAGAGQDFQIRRYNDSSVLIDAPIFIPRLTGIVQMALGATTLTQAATNNTTAVATTAFVKSNLAVKVTVSNTAPSSPATNDVWIDTT